MYGWNNGETLLQQLYVNNDIEILSKYWLLPQNLDFILNFNTNFSAFAVSGIINIEACINSGGRPYGGWEVL